MNTYWVQFHGLHVKAESEELAEKEALAIIADGPGYLEVSEVELDEENVQPD